MKPLLTLILTLCVTAATSHAELPPAQRILFLGDSITYGGTYIQIIEAAAIAQHPDRTIEMLNLGLSSETVSGLSEDGHAGGKFPRPDLHERLDRVLTAVKPDLVIACYGMNDGIYFPLSEDRFTAYRSGIQRLRQKVLAIGASIIHLTPPVFDPQPIRAKVLPAGLDSYPAPFEGYNTVLDAYSDWLLTQAKTQGWTVLDLHGPMNAALAQNRTSDPTFTFSKDGIHPNDAGHLVMATPLLKAWKLTVTPQGHPDHPHGPALFAEVKKKQLLLRDAWLTHTNHLRPGVKAGLPLPEAQHQATAHDATARALAQQKQTATFPGPATDWHGFAKYEFDLAGHTATVVTPKTPAPNRPWVWHGEFFGHKPAPDIALLDKGYHIAYLKAPNLLGSPTAVRLWETFYTHLTQQHHLAAKPALVGLSRGGLYCYHWAIAHPDKVACLYADAPVCDFKSWPGGKGKGKGDPTNWALVLKLWNFPDEATALAWPGNPIDQLAPLAQHKIPLLHVFGDTDDVVPWEENTGLIHQRYTALGGPIDLIRKPGIGHHPHGLEDPTPIIDFILRHTSS
jgi:lysophospholipase L1-like esterase/pimeloyl-ACP methyl ester carboxylesterase